MSLKSGTFLIHWKLWILQRSDFVYIGLQLTVLIYLNYGVENNSAIVLLKNINVNFFFEYISKSLNSGWLSSAIMFATFSVANIFREWLIVYNKKYES